MRTDPERARLEQDARREKDWKRWGPYLSERQWGTVREDYSADGEPWRYFPHDQSRSRAYRWGEDGLLGITDRQCRLCFAVALWNGKDPILKERLFGLANHEGNHGEDVKEAYFYLDSAPTHSYMKGLYKYPQAEFPYRRLLDENGRRGRGEPEYELEDTGIFDEGRYFDVFAEYAKASPDDILIRIAVANRGPERARLLLLPSLWFRNTWSWGRSGEGYWTKPGIERSGEDGLSARHSELGRFRLAAGPGPGGKLPAFLFTDNETNLKKLYGAPNRSPYVKDAFHEYVVHGRAEAVNVRGAGTKAAALYDLDVPPGEAVTVRLRLNPETGDPAPPWDREFDDILDERAREADEFYGGALAMRLPAQERRVLRQAYAGLLWSKQYYCYAVEQWLEGDPSDPPPPESRKRRRNSDWPHLYNRDVISMPDKWEYPWYSSWDLAFHAVALARVDPEFAKEQLILLLREWYMHPNGQLPAYEYQLSNVTPPVHAWACWRVYHISAESGGCDRLFLERCFQKLLLNFTWWVNRKDIEGNHLFSGGFLGLDNISVFDRSKPLPGGGHLEQADGTAWMAFYCSTMLSMALELAHQDRAYEDIASKFFEHFIAIADAINTVGGSGLWDEEDGFYYDQLHIDGAIHPLKVRSIVGLIPLLAVGLLDEEMMGPLRGFRKRMDWFMENRRELTQSISCMATFEKRTHHRCLMAIPTRRRLERTLRYVFDENEFLSPYGVRSLSRVHRDRPYVCRDGGGRLEGEAFEVRYVPGESDTALFGGNSNWRGPIWFPINYLLIEALERYHHFFGDALTVEFPTGSGRSLTLGAIAGDLSARLIRLFVPGPDGKIPWQGGSPRFAADPHWRDLSLFHEYFHGDTGRGLGAAHQTGWTALVARLLEETARA